jgi:TonB family protein
MLIVCIVGTIALAGPGWSQGVTDGKSASETLVRTKAVALTMRSPGYPWREKRAGNEGWVLLSVIVNADGKLRDVVVMDHAGSQSFEDFALKWAKSNVWLPATLDGKPVEDFNAQVKVTFRYPSFVTHEPMFNAQTKAEAEIDKGSFGEAIATLQTALRGQSATIQEMSEAELSIATSYAQQHNVQEAIRHVRRAMMQGFYPTDVRKRIEILDFTITVELAGGHYLEAKDVASTYLRTISNLRPDDPITQKLALFAELLKKPEAIRASGELLSWSEDETKGIWTHKLFRRTWAFGNLNGSFDHFHLACNGEAFDAAPNNNQQWTTKENAGNCTLIVFGTPGSTFDFIQTD